MSTPDDRPSDDESRVLTRPNADALPILIEIPHSGLNIPEEIADQIEGDAAALLRDSDIYVDELYKDAVECGATVLASPVSRYVVDLNRAPNDVDELVFDPDKLTHPAHPKGVVWRVATDGRPLLRRALSKQEVKERVARYHRPYHEALQHELSRLRDHFGYVVMIAAHSMPAYGPSVWGGPKVRRADVVPGTRNGTSASATLIERISAHFEAEGLSVRHDDPYRGGWTTQRYGRPAEGQHVVQLELNRELYVDEATRERKLGPFEALRLTLRSLIENLATLSAADL